MKHPSFVKGCRVCEINAAVVPSPGGTVFENDLWLIRHAPPPYSVPGWMMLHTQRHVAGPAHFDDSEAGDFGFALRHFQRVLTGTLLRRARHVQGAGGGAAMTLWGTETRSRGAPGYSCKHAAEAVVPEHRSSRPDRLPPRERRV